MIALNAAGNHKVIRLSCWRFSSSLCQRLSPSSRMHASNTKTLALSIPNTALLLLLPGLYIADVLYGFQRFLGIQSGITPGTIIRGFAFIVCLFLVIANARRVDAFRLAYLYLLLWLMVLGIATSVAGNLSWNTFFFEIRTASKVLFGPTMAIFLCLLISRWRLSTDILIKYIECCFYLLGVALFAMQSMNIGEATYGDYSSGSKGLFGPQNDISLTLSLSMVASIYRNLLHPSALRVLLTVLATFGFVGLGTRTSLLVAVAVPVLVTLIVLCSNWRFTLPLAKFRLIFAMGPLLAVLVVTAGYITIQQINQYDYQVRKYESLAEYNHPRERLIAAGREYLEGRDTGTALLGEGADRYRSGVYQHWKGKSPTGKRITEVDWLDLYGQYGFLFVAMLYIPLAGLILVAVLRWAWVRHPVDGLAATGLAIYFAHSILAGHALVSPIPSSLAASYAALIIMLPRMDYFRRVEPRSLGRN